MDHETARQQQEQQDLAGGAPPPPPNPTPVLIPLPAQGAAPSSSQSDLPNFDGQQLVYPVLPPTASTTTPPPPPAKPITPDPRPQPARTPRSPLRPEIESIPLNMIALFWDQPPPLKPSLLATSQHGRARKLYMCPRFYDMWHPWDPEHPAQTASLWVGFFVAMLLPAKGITLVARQVWFAIINGNVQPVLLLNFGLSPNRNWRLKKTYISFLIFFLQALHPGA